VKLTGDALDRTDGIVAPGANVSMADIFCTPPTLERSGLRRRSRQVLANTLA
jgi:hypothetical protein